ncbi:putative short-chain dehydrogenase [Lophiostoma macrostomum CBS 122681]|uniref:Putative short-chain dehydrogenase n=1 Tax=Lophiostoma macrostomum CBS 122681 TaxID=1314788 RepID=A0A6A6SP71_9PLEO|nr:putative short-chain dehydrogenase [Lophiostoma macrostomum CBS 122681]
MGSTADLFPGDKYFKSFTKTWHNKPYPQISPLLPTLQATSNVVFITGGGTGIGKATAIAFAQAGAKVIAIFGRRVERLQTAAEEIRKANPNGKTAVIFEAVDLSRRAAVDAAFAKALAKAGETQIDIFIHNAGILQTHGLVAGYDYDEFRNGVELNMFGAFNAVQAMYPLLAPDAKVFNISSGIAHINTLPRVWAYASTKIANARMFEFLQSENPNLRVVNIQPGVIDTEINASTEMNGIGVDHIDLPAHFLVWLASSEADFLQGRFVWVNWDVDELKGRADEIKSSQVLTLGLHGVPM